MILDRNGNEVKEITLRRAEWCKFISKTNTEYQLSNANGKLRAYKLAPFRDVKLTNEMKKLNIKLA